MWGIILTDAGGSEVDRVMIDAPFEAMRGLCRTVLEARPEAVRAQLLCTDGSFEYAFPEPRPDC